MALVDKSYSEYPNVNTINESDLFLISSDFPNGYDTRKTTTRTLANAINNQLEMASLDTGDKTIVGAINELKSLVKYQRGDVIKLRAGYGAFNGIKYNDTQLRFMIPLEKSWDDDLTISLETDLFTINTWFYNGNKTIDTAPVSITLPANQPTTYKMVQINVTYDAEVIRDIPRHFSWRFNSINDNYFRLRFT